MLFLSRNRKHLPIGKLLTTTEMQPKTYKNFFLPVRDALDVLNGKWRLPIIISISAGNTRFNEIERNIPGMTSKILAKELKELLTHQLIQRGIDDDNRVS